jgi:hypothetical protein
MTLRNKINLSLIFFLILAIFWIAFLIYPLLRDVKNYSNEIISQKKEQLSLENKIKDIEEFRKNYAKIKPNLEKIESLFANSEAPIDFISFLEKTSQDCHLTIKIAPVAITKKTKEPWPSLGFSITSAGSFPNFLRFLEKLESGLFLTEIQNLSIKRLLDTELKSKEFENLSVGDIQANFLIKVFAR